MADKKNEETKKPSFVNETRSELKKVTWPTISELMKNTGLVLAMVISFALLVWAMDTLLSWALSLLIR